MPFAIGFLTVEGWEKAISPDYDVFVAPIKETRMRPTGYEQRDYYTVLSQPVDDEIDYVRVWTGSETFLAGEPLDKERAVQKGAEVAWDLIIEWLKEKGHTWHEAVVGIPKDIEPFTGTAGFLTYNRRNKTWFRNANDSGISDPFYEA